MKVVPLPHTVPAPAFAVTVAVYGPVPETVTLLLLRKYSAVTPAPEQEVVWALAKREDESTKERIDKRMVDFFIIY